MTWLRGLAVGLGLLAAIFLVMGIWIAAPLTPDSRYGAAAQAAMEKW